MTLIDDLIERLKKGGNMVKPRRRKRDNLRRLSKTEKAERASKKAMAKAVKREVKMYVDERKRIAMELWTGSVSTPKVLTTEDVLNAVNKASEVVDDEAI